MVGAAGIEPATSGPPCQRSASELRPVDKKVNIPEKVKKIKCLIYHQKSFSAEKTANF
jgi:hypothetical protein